MQTLAVSASSFDHLETGAALDVVCREISGSEQAKLVAVNKKLLDMLKRIQMPLAQGLKPKALVMLKTIECKNGPWVYGGDMTHSIEVEVGDVLFDNGYAAIWLSDENKLVVRLAEIFHKSTWPLAEAGDITGLDTYLRSRISFAVTDMVVKLRAQKERAMDQLAQTAKELHDAEKLKSWTEIF